MKHTQQLLILLLIAGCQAATQPKEQIFSNSEYSGNISSLYAIESAGTAEIPTDFKWRDSTGATHSLSDYKGNSVVLLNFWATWCGNCANEMPTLQDLQLSSKTPVIVIGVSIDVDGHTFTTVHDYAAAHGIRYQLVVDSSESLYVNYVAQSNGNAGTPETFVIGKDGTIKMLLVGAQSKDVFQAAIEKAG